VFLVGLGCIRKGENIKQRRKIKGKRGDYVTDNNAQILKDKQLRIILKSGFNYNGICISADPSEIVIKDRKLGLMLINRSSIERIEIQECKQ